MKRTVVWMGLLGAWATSAAAQDGIVDRVTALEPKLDRIERLLELSVRPWEEAGNLRRLVDSLGPPDSPQSIEILRQHEFMMWRNGGMRRLIFSTWNGGWRVMTDPYLRGDQVENFFLGGSFWITGTLASQDDACDRTPDHVFHFYYIHGPDGVVPRDANGCSPESMVYRRARVFASDLPAKLPD